MNTNDWKKRLRDIFSVARFGASGRNEYTLQRLYSEVSPPSRDALISELNKLVLDGLLDVVFRVVSPTTGAGLFESKNIQDIPSKIHDDTDGIELTVRPARDIELIYKRHAI